MINDYTTTVIIPCFNASKTIEKALASLEKQTYKKFQVYIVNDGSTDKTLSAIESYEKSSTLNITVFTKKNAGVSAARNYAIDRCNTKFISFLDADDEYDCNFLRSMTHVLLDNDFDTVAARYEFIRNADERFALPLKLSYKEVNKYDLIKLYTHKRIEKINFGGFLYKRNILNQYHIRFDGNIRFGEDTLFICQYLKYCKRGGFIDAPLYHYYINETSATHIVTYDIVQNIEAYKRVVEYWKDDLKYDQKWGSYIISRAIWSTAKTFAQTNKEYFDKLQKNYDVHRAMDLMAKEGDEKSIRISAKMFLINPNLFYHIINALSKFMDK